MDPVQAHPVLSHWTTSAINGTTGLASQRVVGALLTENVLAWFQHAGFQRHRQANGANEIGRNLGWTEESDHGWIDGE
jgi:hypothetical protein